MDPAVQDFYCRACSILSLTVFGVFFCLSRFVKLQFADSKLPFSIFILILLVALSTFANNPDLVRTTMDLISTHPSGWIRCICKAFGQFFILALVTTLIVWIKYSRFRVSDISAISKQGDQMGFFAAGAFSLYILSTSMLLKLREEFGLFYLSLEYTMTAAVEMPHSGGQIVSWRYVGPAAFYCFLLIIVRCYCHSSDEVGRRCGNGDDDDAGDPVRFWLESQPPTRDEENQQGGGDDAAEGGGGGRETDDQGHRKHPDGSGSGEFETISSTSELDVSSDQRKFAKGRPLPPKRGTIKQRIVQNLSKEAI